MDFQKVIDGMTIEVDSIEHSIAIVLSYAYGNSAIEDARLGLEKLLIQKKS